MITINGFTTFVDTMLPSIARNSILDHIQRIMKDLDEVVIPSLSVENNTIERTDAYKFLERSIKSETTKYRGSVIGYMKETAQRLLDGQRDLETLINKTFGKEIAKEGLDYKRAQILNMINLLEFFNRYTLQFLLVATKEALADKYYGSEKRDKDYVLSNNNANLYGKVCLALEKKFSEYDKIMRKLDGVTIDQETRALTESNLGKEADPMETNFYTVDFNIFYLIGKVYNGLYVYFFEIKQQQALKLQQHVVKLKLKRDGASDEELVEVDKAIVYHTNRLNRLQGEIEVELNDANGD